MIDGIDMTYRLAVAVCLCVAALAVAGPATRPAGPPQAGDKAPDLSLKTIDGKPVRLDELQKQGPVVILQLRGWVGYQCPLCSKQVGAFLAKAGEIRAAGATVVMVYPGTADGLDAHAADFVRGKSLPEGFYFALDPDLTFVNAWHLRWDAPKETAYPATFVVKDGSVTFAKVSHTHGDRASVADFLKAVKNAEHP